MLLIVFMLVSSPAKYKMSYKCKTLRRNWSRWSLASENTTALQRERFKSRMQRGHNALLGETYL